MDLAKASKNKEFGKSFFNERYQYLVALHRPLQKKVALFAGPAVLLLYGLALYRLPCWQNKVMFAGAILMMVFWVYAAWLSGIGKLSTSVSIFTVSVISLVTISGLVIEGRESTALVASVGVVIYASLFSKRHFFLGFVSVILSFILVQTAAYSNWIPRRIMSDGEMFASKIAMGGVAFLAIGVLLRRGQTMNEKLFFGMEKENARQSKTISTIDRIVPVIDDAIEQITRVSNQFASQAQEQAAAAAEVNSTLAGIGRKSKETVEIAGDTQKISERIRMESEESRQGLHSVDRRFDEVIIEIEGSRSEVERLAENAEQIEDMLKFNMEISHNIKVLAVNASIQAAEAGEYGAGFRVVAQELSEMIQSTEENLNRSRDLLGAVKNGTRVSADKMGRGTIHLHDSVSELRRTATMIESSTNNFARASSMVEKITDAANKQQSGISEVRIAMEQIDVAAVQLSDSTRILLESVQSIVQAQSELNEIMKDKERS
jgi:methyl-accepting chemotaxis protein